MCLAAWPLNESEAEGDLVLIPLCFSDVNEAVLTPYLNIIEKGLSISKLHVYTARCNADGCYLLICDVMEHCP